MHVLFNLILVSYNEQMFLKHSTFKSKIKTTHYTALQVPTTY